MADPLDPILVKTTRAMVEAQNNAQKAGATLAPADLDAFVREETQGKYSLKDAQKYLSSIDSGVSVRNVGRSALQGLTMNFGDEILGALPSWLGGGEGAKEDMRLRGSLFQKQHPYVDFGAGAVGAIAPTLLAPEAEAATAGSAMVRGAATGAAVGGLSGAGAGEGTKDRLTRGAVGAAAGGTLGAVVPGIVASANYLRDPAARASARIAHAIDQSGGIDAVKASVSKAAAAGRGGEMMLADASDPLRGAADFAANNSDDTLFPLAKEIKTRQANQSQRLLNDVRSGLPGGDADAGDRLAQLTQSTQQWADGPNGYGGLRDKNPQFDIADVKTAIGKPTVQSAWKQARLAGDLTENSPLDQLLQKIMASNPHVDPATLMEGAKAGALGTDVAKMANAGERGVSFDDLQQLRRALQGKSDAAWRSGNGALGQSYSTIQEAVDGALEKGVPGYQAVNQEYGMRKGLERALEAGQKAWDVEDTRALSRETAKLSPPELNEYRTGMASRLISQLRGAATNRDEASRLMNGSQALEDKLQTIFGDKATFDQYMGRASVEAELSKIKGAVSGSQTARRLQAGGFDPAEIGADAGLHALMNGSHGMLSALKSVGAKAVRGAVTRNTAREMGPMLMLKGAPNIQSFLDSFAQRDPLVGALGTKVLPAAAGRAASLLNF